MLPLRAARPAKRTRPVDDVDGEDSIPQIKKRRLRLSFVTSRLSNPFSEPSTFILGRGAHKIASWIRRAIRAIRPPPPLIQVALLNNARIQAALSLPQAQSLSRDQLREVIEIRRGASQTTAKRSPIATGEASQRRDEEIDVVSHQRTQTLSPQATSHTSLPFSPPTGLSNYDVFDSEYEATAGEREEGWESADATSEVYSDFTIIQSEPAFTDEHDGPFPETILAELDSRHDRDHTNMPENKAVQLMRHGERQRHP